MNSGQIVSLLATSAALFGLALHLWAWRHLRDAAAKRRVWSSSILFGAMLILFFMRVVHMSESFRVVMAALAGGMVLVGALLGASRVNLSNDPLRNAWWSGLLQGLTIALAVVVLTLMALASMRI